MKEMFEKVLTSIGTLLYFALIIGFLFCWTYMIDGILWICNLICPYFSLTYTITLFLCFFIFIPLAIFKKTKLFSSICLLILSCIFGVMLWVFSFLTTYYFWSYTGVTIGLLILGIGVFPIGLLATCIHMDCGSFFNLILGAIFTFGVRILSFCISEQYEKTKQEEYYNQDVHYQYNNENQELKNKLDKLSRGLPDGFNSIDEYIECLDDSEGVQQ